MKNTFRIRPIRGIFGVIGMAAMALLSPAQAAEPWLAGPSISSVGTQISFGGGNFVPGSVVLVRSAAQGSGATTTASVTVAPGGTIAHAFTPSNEGTYRIAVIDTQGKEIVSTNLKIVR